MCDLEGDDDGVSVDVWNEVTVVARKEHRCSSCGALISPGERYMRLFAVIDGEPEPECCCATCNEARVAFQVEHALRVPPAALLDCLDECIDTGEQDSVRWKPVAFGIRERWAAAKSARKAAST